MYSEEIEKLIKYAIIDGKVSSKERKILLRKAAELGIAKDEFEMVLDARIFEVNNQNKNVQKSFPGHQSNQSSLLNVQTAKRSLILIQLPATIVSIQWLEESPIHQFSIYLIYLRRLSLKEGKVQDLSYLL